MFYNFCSDCTYVGVAEKSLIKLMVRFTAKISSELIRLLREMIDFSQQ